MVVGHPVYLPFRVKFRGNRVKCPKKFRGNRVKCPKKFRGNRVKRLKKSRGNRKDYSLSIDNLRFIY